MTSSSAAILYPTLKGLESSNSSFVQVSRPITDVNRNSTSNHRNHATKTEWGYKFKHSKSHELAEKNDDTLTNRRQQRDHSSRVPILNDKEFGNHGKFTEPVNQYGTTSDDDFRTTLEVDKSKQYEKRSEEIAELSLIKPEMVQGLIKKHPKHTIIINNTFINRPTTEQDEFLAKFSPTFYSQNPNVVLVLDALPSVAENDMKILSDGVREEHSKTEVDSNNPSTDVEKLHFVWDEPNDKSPIVDGSFPLGSIVTAILWLVLILFWLLLYLKVVNLYNPLPKVIPKPEPTNFEFCLIVIMKFRSLIVELWRLW